MNLELYEKINKLNILVFGDYMIDEYINGEVSRISPEAPVPVLNIKSRTKKIGGAGNVINNILSLGAKVRVIGRIGNDDNGKYLKKFFTDNNVDNQFLLEQDEYNTIIKTRIVSRNQQFMRLDDEKVESIPKNILEQINNNIDMILDNIDIVVISDYAKGNITKESIEMLIKEAKKRNIPVIVDPKGKDYSKYAGATICTPNLKELSDVTGEKLTNEEEILKASEKLIKDIDLQKLVLTRSEDGISLIDDLGIKKDFPALKKEVVDVSGAGDTVVAAISVFMGLNYDMDKICKLANVAASVVVSKFGTSTVSYEEIQNALEDTYNDKILTINMLKSVVKMLKDQNKKISFTNGCFDLLHAGHIDSLTQSKSYGDILIVGVNSDSSVKRNKGEDRPIISEKFRLMMLSSLECVDYAVLFDGDTAVDLVKIIKPDFYVKGCDYEGKVTPETEIVNSYGGECKYIKIEQDISTSKIIKKIKDTKNA